MDIMKDFLLLFQDLRTEERFRQKKVGFQSVSLRVLCLTLIAQSSAIFFSNPLHIDLFQAGYLIMFLLSMILVFLVYIVVLKKYIEYCEIAISFLVIAFIIGVSEFAKKFFDQRDWTPSIFLLLGMNFQTGCLMLIISRIRWTRNLFSISILQIYIWIRTLDCENNEMVQKPAVITLVIYLVIFPYFCYVGEKEDRSAFTATETLQGHLKGFEELIKTVIPSSILIVKDGIICFFNKRTQDIFNIQNEKELLELLGKLKVEP
jgi:hypothetical protein